MAYPSKPGRLVERLWKKEMLRRREADSRDQYRDFLCESPFLNGRLKRNRKRECQGEYYLTDLVEIAKRKGLRCSAHIAADPMEVMGINTRATSPSPMKN